MNGGGGFGRVGETGTQGDDPGPGGNINANNQLVPLAGGSGGSGSSARVQDIPGRGGTIFFTVSSKSSAGGSLTAISSLPTIEIVALPEIDSTPSVSILTNPIADEVIAFSRKRFLLNEGIMTEKNG